MAESQTVAEGPPVNVQRPPLLAYGDTRRINYALFARRTLVALLTLVAFAVGVWITAQEMYYEDRDRVQTYFEEIPGVRDVHVVGYSDITYEPVWATVQLGGTGRSITFCADPPESLRAGKRVVISAIGPYSLETFSYGYFNCRDATGKPVKTEAYGAGIDIGREGAFAHLIPFEVRSPEDVVRNYDRLISIFATLPRSGRCTDTSGTEHRYQIK